MINYVVCDLFSSPARVLVNTVNTVGVMGKGIAKDFKTIYPDMFGEYQALCERKQFEIGHLWLYKTGHKWILNFPTKRHWRQPSRPEYIQAGLQKFVDTYHILGITSISFPLLGCGNGELDWETAVRPLMEKYLSKLPITIYVHLQFANDRFQPEHRNIKEVKKWLNGEPESLAFSEVWTDLGEIFSEQTDISQADESERPFTVIMNRATDELVIRTESGELKLPADAIMDLWQQVRQSGFVAADSMPCGLDSFARYVVPVMAKLPYLHPVAMSSTYEKFANSPFGLRIAPRSQDSQPNLFASVGTVEPR